MKTHQQGRLGVINGFTELYAAIERRREGETNRRVGRNTLHVIQYIFEKIVLRRHTLDILHITSTCVLVAGAQRDFECSEFFFYYYYFCV